jgi:hypothetical protein
MAKPFFEALKGEYRFNFIKLTIDRVHYQFVNSFPRLLGFSVQVSGLTLADASRS